MSHSAARTARRLMGAGLLLLVAATCTIRPHRPFDSRADLERRYTERLGPELAAAIRIPSELSPELIAEIETRLPARSSERRQTDAVLDFVFRDLGLRYSAVPTRDALETYRVREANCLSFVHLFVGISRIQHLNPFYVEVEDFHRWSFRDGAVVSQGHIVAGMYLGGQLSTFDFLPYRPKPYRQLKPIDELTAMAHHYNNLGAEALLAGNPDRAREQVEIAHRLAPDFDKAINNLGVLMLRSGETAEAAALYEEALRLHPENVPLLNNMARVYQAQGRNDDAQELLQRAEQVEAANPFLRLYSAELALARGDAAQALEHMRSALVAASELPEIHVGLVKVYLALGQTDKARHHVERALTLDATHEEARLYAALLAGSAQ